MATYDYYARLEPRPHDRDTQAGFEAPILDPVWFLARQWQMGEHQGENASSPVVVSYTLGAAEIAGPPGAADPAVTPAEGTLEAERDDWWTLGRRVRVGQKVAGAVAIPADPRLRLDRPPPPYQRLHGAPDGRALWKFRGELGIAATEFGDDAPGAEPAESWKTDRLLYEQDYPTGGALLQVRDHHGGEVDWYSADASGPVAFTPASADPFTVVPGPLEYPGAPNPRWWQIENAATDVGGYPPDVAHFATMLLVELIYSHGDDWFLFPVTAKAGQVVAVTGFEVKDSFGRVYRDTDPRYRDGLSPPEDWSLFRCRGLDPAGLVLWNVAESPLEGPVLERVQFGLDEQANHLWAVERVVEGREFAPPDGATPDAGHPPYQTGKPTGQVGGPMRWLYTAGQGMAAGWHPYRIDDDSPDRVFVQWGLADLSRQVPLPLPRPAAEVLKAAAGTPELHRIRPAVVPSNGIEVERRRMLARDLNGRPVLWTQRQRKPLRSPPARGLRYDVVVENFAE
jgi:hypothetical protein